MAAMEAQTESITLLVAPAIPDVVDVKEIAEKALQEGFKVIADEITAATGERTSGDFMPDEVFALERVFSLFVRAMAVNNGACHKEGPKRTLLARFDVSGLSDDEIAALESEVIVQAEYSKGDGFTETPGHPGVEVAVEIIEENS